MYAPPAPVVVPPDVPGRREYLQAVHKMSVDELKREMASHGLKAGSKAMMRQCLEMAFDAMHPNRDMQAVLKRHMREQKEEKEKQIREENERNFDDW